MNGIKVWIEEHPYLTGGLVLGILVLYFILTSGSKSSPAQSAGVGGTGLSSSDYASLQAAQLQSATQLQEQQNAATAQGNQLSAELAATQLQTQAQSHATDLAAQVQLQNILTSGQVGENTNATQLALAQVQSGGQVQLAGISAQENEYTAGTQAQTLESEYNAAIKSQGIISQAQTDQAKINADTQQSIADYAAQVQLGAQDVQKLGITTQGNLDYASILAQQHEYDTGVGGTVSEQQNYLNYLQGVQTQGIDLVKSGTLNKGGSGGANQVSFLSTLFGGSGQAPTPTTGGFSFSIPGLVSVGAQP